MNSKNKKRRKPHWYFITYFECPVCGRGSTLRERRYGKKPKVREKRYEFVQDTTCYCHLM